ncbi:MAG: DNA polymerase IV [Oscillospiraceae bacterium]|jgi:DNA polymerase-4/DNA polymerase IV (DinB-like DNA polymerase)|nr:DNA polymerase IV [Oscillospiraceae bacterium]
MKTFTIIHVDMDAFYAAVEVRDNPSLGGKPLIIGALPHERGVVATCSYEAREYGVRSAMSIKEAYRRCPQGVYMHPNMDKYVSASERFREIWLTYTDLIEFISLDEGFLDVTGTAAHFGGASPQNCGAKKIAFDIKKRTLDEVGLTCSVGVGYTKTSAKLASEEKKPDGFYEILTPDAFTSLIIDRPVRVIYGVGPKTAEVLNNAGLYTVRDILSKKHTVVELLGNHGNHVIDLAEGIDERRVTPYYEAEAKSISREWTFQQDISDMDHLKDALRLFAKELSFGLRRDGIFARTVTVKVKYANMKLITRSKSGEAINRTNDIYSIAAALIDTIDKRPVRLVGLGLSGFDEPDYRQLTLDDISEPQAKERKSALDKTLLDLQQRYGSDIIKTGNEIIAEKRFSSEPETSSHS